MDGWRWAGLWDFASRLMGGERYCERRGEERRGWGGYLLTSGDCLRDENRNCQIDRWLQGKCLGMEWFCGLFLSIRVGIEEMFKFLGFVQRKC